MPVDKDTIKNIFILKLGEPFNHDHFEEYLKIVTTDRINEGNEYCELHHICPVSVFEELKDNVNFLIKLTYEEHVNAHVLLAKSYPIRKFIRPLNFMISSEKNSELLSLCTQEWWKKFKSDIRYKNWKKQKSLQLKKRWKNLEYNEFMRSVSKKRFISKEERNKVSQQFKKLWENPEYKKNQTEKIKKIWEDENYKQKQKLNAIKRWQDENYKLKMKEKMDIVNKDEIKRKNAGEKIKNLWKTPEFREKALKRKKTYWYNNGITEIKTSECPEGFIKGRIKGKSKRKINETN